MSKLSEIPKEQELLFDTLLGIIVTLEYIRETVSVLETKMEKIEDQLDFLIEDSKEKHNTNFGNKVSKWLKHTKK